MTAFDLLFLVCFLAGTATLAASGIRALRGRPAAVLLRRLGIGLAIYLIVLLAVSLFSPQRFASIGTAQCSDDWCLTLAGVTQQETRTGREYTRRIDLSSRARGARQRERFVSVYLRSDDGRRFDPLPDAGAIPFDTLLSAGQSVQLTRRFRVPPATRLAGMVVAREGIGRFPGCCIIGDENSFGHAHTILRLTSP